MTLKRDTNNTKNADAAETYANEGQRASTKIIELNSAAFEISKGPESNSDNCCTSNRIPIEKLRAVWNDKHIEYNDAELLRIREWCYVMVEAVLEVIDNPAFKPPSDAISKLAAPITAQPPHSIILSKSPNHEEENCHPLRPSLYRRTG